MLACNSRTVTSGWWILCNVSILKEIYFKRKENNTKPTDKIVY